MGIVFKGWNFFTFTSSLIIKSATYENGNYKHLKTLQTFNAKFMLRNSLSFRTENVSL